MTLITKRVKWTCVACGLLATPGFFIAPFHWPLMGIAIVTGLVSGGILIAALKGHEKHASAFAGIPVFLGWFISRNAFSADNNGVVGLAAAFSVLGSAYLIAFGLTLACSANDNEAKIG